MQPRCQNRIYAHPKPDSIQKALFIQHHTLNGRVSQIHTALTLMANKRAAESSTFSCALSNLKELEVPSWIRGYHAYKDSLEIEIGEVLELQHEPKNLQDKNAIAVIRDEEVVGHMPRALASSKQGTGIVRHFLTKPESKGTVKAEGKAVNRGGGYGMEVPCVYRFTGQQKYVEMLRNLLDLQNNLSVRNVHKTDETLKRAKEQEGSRVKKTKLC